jgi:hypothetical protein
MATRFCLDGPEIESRYRWDIPHPTRVTLGSHNLKYNEYRVYRDSSDRPKLEDTTNPTTHGDWRLYVQN